MDENYFAAQSLTDPIREKVIYILTRYLINHYYYNAQVYNTMLSNLFALLYYYNTQCHDYHRVGGHLKQVKQCI